MTILALAAMGIGLGVLLGVLTHDIAIGVLVPLAVVVLPFAVITLWRRRA
jgi:hypothetical protein